MTSSIQSSSSVFLSINSCAIPERLSSSVFYNEYVKSCNESTVAETLISQVSLYLFESREAAFCCCYCDWLSVSQAYGHQLAFFHTCLLIKNIRNSLYSHLQISMASRVLALMASGNIYKCRWSFCMSITVWYNLHTS